VKKDSDFYHQLGRGHINNKRYNDAIESITEAINLNPDNYKYYLDRAIAKQCLNQFEDALVDIDSAIGIKPDDPMLPRFREVIAFWSQSQVPTINP